MMWVWLVAGVLALFLATVAFGAPYVPTRRRWARAALDLAAVRRGDVVVDLGSGDGVILKLAAERGARALGYEINPLLVVASRLRLWRFGQRAQVKLRNFWRIDLPPDTTVVYVFSVGRDLPKLTKYLTQQAEKLDARPLRVVIFGFNLPGLTAVKENKVAKLYEL
jgi:hypothetical protein